jgi:cytochrome c
MPDNRAFVSAGYDATVLIWSLDGGNDITTTLPAPLNAVAVLSDDKSSPVAPDGKLFFIARNGEVRAEIQTMDAPIISLAVSPNHTLIAAASVRGSVAIIDSTTGKLLRTLVGPVLPVWSVAFSPDSPTLLTGGTDRIIRHWSTRTGDPIDAVPLGRQGQQSARRLCRQSRRRNLSRLYRLSYPFSRRRSNFRFQKRVRRTRVEYRRTSKLTPHSLALR